MLTLRAAAALLASTRSFDDLARLLPPLGFPDPPAVLDQELRAELGLPPAICHAGVARGAGELRALLLDVENGTPHEILTHVGRRLASQSPQLRILILAVARAPLRVALATWDQAGASRPHVRSLVVDPDHVLDSDGETFAAFAAVHEPDTLLVHLRWTEILGREAVGRRFYRALESQVSLLAAMAGGVASAADRTEVALLHVSRLLFLSFVQARGWLDGDRDFLLHAFDACMRAGGGFERRVLRPLFYGTLNTPATKRARAARAFGRIPFLNGGLFARAPVERRCHTLRFGDESWGSLFAELLSRYRFTAREERADWSEAAIDPEMLGRAFESLMAHRERRSSGSFYTPYRLVSRINERTLHAALASELRPAFGRDGASRIASASLAGEVAGDAAAKVRAALAQFTVLDPACGSGAFLVHLLERLSDLLHAAGDPRPLHEIRRTVLTRSIFGVDRNPTAVWLCELRLWLSIVIERDEGEPMRLPPLPNLDRNVRVGDSLADWDFSQGDLPRVEGARARALRERYARATGARKATLARILDRDQRARTVVRIERELARVRDARRELVALRRTPDLFGTRPRADAAQVAQAASLRARAAELRRELRRLRDGGALPLAFDAHFPDVASRGGFSVVVGNPPWVRLHRIPSEDRVRWRRDFSVYRSASWEAGALAAGAGRSFGAQVDLAALFTERAMRLLRPGGTIGFLVPVKLWQSLAGGGLRRLLWGNTQLVHLEDCSGDAAAFDAAVYPSLLVATRCESGTDPDAIVSAAAQRGPARTEWNAPGAALPLQGTPDSPWLLLPAAVRAAFDRLGSGTLPLSQTAFGRPLLGAKCGCNEAYLVRLVEHGAAVSVVRDSEGREGRVETSLLRPVIRGEHLRGWRCATDEWIIWPHDSHGAALDSLPPDVAAWFARFRRRLVERADFKGGRRWWSAFRTDGAANDLPRVTWPDISLQPTAVVLDEGDPSVPINSCYVLRAPHADDAHALAALLRSPLVAAWLHCCAEPARGGYRRHLAWTIALLPLPRRWDRARELLAPFGRAGASGAEVAAGDLACAAAEAYGVSLRDLEPLLDWAA